MRHGQKALVLIAILVGAGLSPLRRSHGRDDTRRLHPCTNKTLQGTYGIQIQGTQPLIEPFTLLTCVNCPNPS